MRILNKMIRRFYQNKRFGLIPSICESLYRIQNERLSKMVYLFENSYFTLKHSQA